MISGTTAPARCLGRFIAIMVTSALVPIAGADAPPIHDGDRIVLVGDSLIERDQHFGWTESTVVASSPGMRTTFRNLGWTGDTPAGASRGGWSEHQAGKEPDGEGYRLLIDAITAQRPDVVVIGYGTASALGRSAEIGGTPDPDGPAAAFAGELDRLVEDLTRWGLGADGSSDLRIVLVTPPPLACESASGSTASSSSPTASLSGPTASPSALASRVAVIREAIVRIGREHDLTVIDLDDLDIGPADRIDPVHLGDSGYRKMAVALARGLVGDSGRGSVAEVPAPLRRAVVRKDRWFFHQSRPANLAYVRGFRRHEQGSNAAELDRYDRWIDDEQARIDAAARGEPIDEPEPIVDSRVADRIPQPTPSLTVADGWTATLWAENPLLNKPVQMNFDHLGRLWVASSANYPMIEVGQTPDDKILILDDTDGDGVADDSIVFADGLLIPTGVLPDLSPVGRVGCWVAQSTDWLWVEDTDGDGRGDATKRVMSGFGTEDTHHNLHTFRRGAGGVVHAAQSIYIRSDIETADGVMRIRGGAGLRFDPRGMSSNDAASGMETTSDLAKPGIGNGMLNVTFGGLLNPWGRVETDDGRTYLTDGAGRDGIWMAPLGARFAHHPDGGPALGSITSGTYPKFCSLEIVDGAGIPAAWRGNLLTCDFRANRVTRFAIAPDGSGTSGGEVADVIRSPDAAFRPIDVKMGPDGAIYIADWANPIINHGEVDFRDPRRDRVHGRIWRLTHDATPRPERIDWRSIDRDAAGELAVDDNPAIRDAASLHLRPIDGDADWWRDRIASATNDRRRLRLIRAAPRPHAEVIVAAAELLASSDDPAVAAAAVRHLAWHAPAACRRAIATLKPAVAPEMVLAVAEAALLSDDAADVRHAVGLALSGGSKPDRFVAHVLARGINRFPRECVEWAASAASAGDEALVFTLSAVDPALAAGTVDRYVEAAVKRGDAADVFNVDGPWFDLIGRSGGVDSVRRLAERMASDAPPGDGGNGVDAVTIRVGLSALASAARRGIDAGVAAETAAGWLRDPSTSAAAGRWIAVDDAVAARGPVQQVLRDLSVDADRPVESRRLAIGSIVVDDASRESTIGVLRQAAGDADVAGAALTAMASIDADAAIGWLMDRQATVTDGAKLRTYWTALLSRRGMIDRLTDAVRGRTLTPSAAEAGIAAAGAIGNSDAARSLIAALTPSAGGVSSPEELTPERLRTLVDQTVRRGDPVRGEAIYHRASLQCVACHRIGDHGGRVGPNLSTIGTGTPLDYLIESLLVPDAKVKENYHAVTILTEDGDIVSGIEAVAAAPGIVRLTAADGSEVTIDEDAIVAKKPAASLMPAGLLDRSSPDDRLHLYAFLSRLGKPDADGGRGRFEVDRHAVRDLEILAGHDRIEQDGVEAVLDGTYDRETSADRWRPFVASVNGDVTPRSLSEATVQPRNRSLVGIYLRFDIAGARRIETTGVSGRVWIDGRGLSADDDASNRWTVPPGTTTAVLRIDPRGVDGPFRVHLRESIDG